MDSLLTFGNGLKIVASDDLNNTTNYIIREQEDWFEDEIHFVRAMLQQNMTVIDVGANHGVYTLSMARCVGQSGTVHAFEPADRTASYLRRSIEANGFNNVVVNQLALSDSIGTAKLFKPGGSELNSLVNDTGRNVEFEEIGTTSLDAYVQSTGLSQIDFIKLDAEGHEIQVLAGAHDVLSRFSPLIMLEVYNGQKLDLDPARKLQGYGYGFYRLVPGLNLLAPFGIDGEATTSQLNLFACKPETANRLMKAGFLASEDGIQPGRPFPSVSKQDLWPGRLLIHPYARRLQSAWHGFLKENDHRPTVYALGLYARSQDPAHSASERYACLVGSFNLLSTLAQQKPAFLRSFSLARVAAALGYKLLAYEVLNRLWASLQSREEVLAFEPFLAPEAWFDGVDPEDRLGSWIGGATAHAMEKYAGFSSAYTYELSHQRLDSIRQYGFVSPEMARRSQLMRERFSLPQ